MIAEVDYWSRVVKENYTRVMVSNLIKMTTKINTNKRLIKMVHSFSSNKHYDSE